MRYVMLLFSAHASALRVTWSHSDLLHFLMPSSCIMFLIYKYHKQLFFFQEGRSTRSEGKWKCCVWLFLSSTVTTKVMDLFVRLKLVQETGIKSSTSSALHGGSKHESSRRVSFCLALSLVKPKTFFGVYRHSGFLGISPAVIWGYRATPVYLWSHPAAAMRLAQGRVPRMCTFFSPHRRKPGMRLCCLVSLDKLQPGSCSRLFKFVLRFLDFSFSSADTQRPVVMRSPWGRLV